MSTNFCRFALAGDRQKPKNQNRDKPMSCCYDSNKKQSKISTSPILADRGESSGVSEFSGASEFFHALQFFELAQTPAHEIRVWAADVGADADQILNILGGAS